MCRGCGFESRSRHGSPKRAVRSTQCVSCSGMRLDRSTAVYRVNRVRFPVGALLPRRRQPWAKLMMMMMHPSHTTPYSQARVGLEGVASFRRKTPHFQCGKTGSTPARELPKTFLKLRAASASPEQATVMWWPGALIRENGDALAW